MSLPPVHLPGEESPHCTFCGALCGCFIVGIVRLLRRRVMGMYPAFTPVAIAAGGAMGL
jgi:hypothetical protein